MVTNAHLIVISTQLTDEIYNKWIHFYLRNNFIPLGIISNYFSLNYNLVIRGMNNDLMQMQLELNIEKK
jgi:hypothetical protein